MFELRDKIAIVTGGTRGIGFSIAEHFAKAGMIVIIVGREAQRVETAIANLSAVSAIVHGYCCDVGDVGEISKIFGLIEKKFEKIDVLVNCAGIMEKSEMDLITEEIWDSTVNTNLKGTFFMSQYCLPLLKKSSAPRIINISSNAGRMGGYENGLAYTASKGGIISLTYGMARRLGEYGITVNCIAPGTIESDMSRSYNTETLNRLLQRFPLKRFGQVDDISSAACYFASDFSSFTTGAVLDINGGLFTG